MFRPLGRGTGRRDFDQLGYWTLLGRSTEIRRVSLSIARDHISNWEKLDYSKFDPAGTGLISTFLAWARFMSWGLGKRSLQVL